MFAVDVEDLLDPTAPAPPRSEDAFAPPSSPSSESGSVPPSEQVLLLRRTIALLGAVEAVELPAVQALAAATALLVARRELDALLLRRLADVDQRPLHRLADSPTTSSWVRAQGSPVDPATVTLAKRLSRHPGVQDAVQSGQLPVPAAARVSATLAKLRPLVDRPDGLIDGQPGDAVVTAVIVDGVLALIGQALGGLPEDDPRITGLAGPPPTHLRVATASWPAATPAAPSPPTNADASVDCR